MSKERFTAWLSEEEREAIRAQAKRLGASQNLLVRLAIRKWFGFDTVDVAPIEGGTEADANAQRTPSEAS